MMSGIVSLNENLQWRASSGVFDEVLETIARELRERDPELADLLLKSRIEVTKCGYLDLRLDN